MTGTASCNVFRQRGNFQNDYVNSYELDAQGQITLQTDYLHGRLSPRLTYIQFIRGTAALHPTLTYRWNDWLLFQADYSLHHRRVPVGRLLPRPRSGVVPRDVSVELTVECGA